jgi:tetratricopeptide (TPR) repeat protein
VLYEFDQLRKRLGHDPAARLRTLERERKTVLRRDDLTIELVTLLNLTGRYGEAAEILSQRRFHPWEGGEGLVSSQWVVAQREGAKSLLAAGRPQLAAGLLEVAMRYPENLGEGKHLLTPQNETHYLLGACLRASGNEASAIEWYVRASEPQGDPAEPAGDGPYWQALALRALGDEDGATARLAALAEVAAELAQAQVAIPYFATSLPTMLLFEDDLSVRAREEARYLEGLVLLGRGQHGQARARFRQLLQARPDHLGATLRLAGR